MQQFQFRSGNINEGVVAQIAVVLCASGVVEVRWSGDISALLGGTSSDQLAMALQTIVEIEMM